MSAVEIDLSRVLAMLTETHNMASDLDATAIDDDRRNNSANRRVTTQLNYLADTLELAAGLVRAEYWHAKGVS